MSMATDIRGTVFKNGPAVLMGRVVGPDGDAVAQSDIASARYSVLEIDHIDHDTLSPVAGHDNVELDVEEVFYDSLQTGGPWSVDATGYNFRHDLDVATDEAFTSAGVDYQVRYEVTPVAGQKIVFRFLVKCI